MFNTRKSINMSGNEIRNERDAQMYEETNELAKQYFEKKGHFLNDRIDNSLQVTTMQHV